MRINAHLLLSLGLTSLVSAKAIHKVAKTNPRAIEKRQYAGNDTENQLLDGTPCRDITVIFARGTFEVGNIGTIVGPQFFQQLVNDTSVDQIAVQGVDYPANVDGFLAGGDVNGSILMSQLAAEAAYQCPDTNLVLSGYSQGAQLVQNAAAMLDDCLTDFVSSVVVFGDPDENDPVGNIPEDKVIRFCNSGDSICHGGDLITASHLNYSNNVVQAAAFVVGLADLSDYMV